MWADELERRLRQPEVEKAVDRAHRRCLPAAKESDIMCLDRLGESTALVPGPGAGAEIITACLFFCQGIHPEAWN